MNTLQLSKPNIAQLKNLFINSNIRSPETKLRYASAIDTFINWHNNQNILIPHNETLFNVYLGKYIESLKARYESTTISAHITALRQWLKFLRGINKEIPEVKIESPKISREEVQYLTDDEVSHILSFEEKTLLDKRDKALLILLFGTGIRSIEAVRAQYKDLQKRGGKMILKVQRKGKTQKKGYVVLDKPVYASIINYINERKNIQPDDPLFGRCGNRNSKIRKSLSTRAIRVIVDKRLNSRKPKGISAHIFRHTAAIHCLANGADVYAVKEMLGHSRVTTTEIYVNTSKRIKDPAEERVNWEEILN